MPAPRPHVSLGIPTFGVPATGDWRHLLDLARAADAAGVDRLVLPDHVVLGPHTADYPWGRFPTDATADWLEPLTTIAALAAVTERVRFLTGILVVPVRPAVLLAKTVATIDVLSAGRIDLGVGVGWQREEFDAVGLDFTHRGALLDRTIADCRTLWSGGPLDVTGVDGIDSQVWCAPVPVQERLPVWFSGTLGHRNLQRIVELGDGWIPIMGSTPDEVADGIELLRAGLTSAGRDPAALQVRAAPALVRDDHGVDLPATLADVARLVAAGVTDVHLPLKAFAPDMGDTAAAGAAMARIVEAVAAAS
ncbi:TIGR03619 family F420-dependent LLM class oxidoreductase [Aquihabitans sp. McL0605]|uniref:TIGR03619 family F420-dependent LLM class oxidoreductase n=1 Tax=Aquihabitans sp. McL0605 TaxID=3415671 RepID=UPI003CEDF19B